VAAEERTGEARQRALLAAIPDLMFRLRRDGTYLEFAGDTSRLATPHDELVGSNMYEILPEPVAEVLMGCVEEALAAGDLRSVEYELTRLGGDVREFEARVVPVDGSRDEAVAIVRDVTEQHQLARELRESRRRAVEAADRERRRFERDLHDGAQQRLTTANVHLHVARKFLELDPGRAREALATAQKELEVGIREIRELVRGLQPAALAADGLGAAVRKLVERASIPVELVELPNERLPEPVERALFYFVSESIANATKHARASEIVVRVASEHDVVRAEVRDDGVGGAALRPSGGIAGLGERLGALGGTLEIESVPGGGTRLVAIVPLVDGIQA